MFDRRDGQPRTSADVLAAELDAVTGLRCGWICTDHHAETFPGCLRAADHEGAQLMADVHVARGEDGQLVVAQECCPVSLADGLHLVERSGIHGAEGLEVLRAANPEG